ncbi:peptidase domain-containing ABC transporter [Proteus hauseri]|uniref:peptidase domain-containing ABC transporter n=1 Tax=Proteus hauseri TaxID=183417 RepID=UPI0032DA3A1F
MDNNKKNNLINAINTIFHLLEKDPINLDIIKETTHIKEIEKLYKFKIKKKQISSILNKNITSPVIFFDKNKNILILLKNNKNEFLILDTNSNKTKKINRKEFITLAKETYYHIEFKNNSSFNIAWFYPVFMKYKATFRSVLFYSFILQILALTTPLAIQMVMDKVIIHQAFSTLDVLIIGLVFIAISEGTLKGIREYIYHHTANKIDMSLSLKLTKHLFKLPLSYFKHRQTGTIVARVKELDIIREFITRTLLLLVVDFLFIFVFIFIMAILSLKLTLLFLATIPLYFILAKIISPKIEQSIQQLYHKSAINTAFLTESIGGIETIKSLSLEPRFTQQWNNQIHQLIYQNLKSQNIDNLSNFIVSSLQKITIALILWFGAYEVINLSMTIGQLIAFNMLLSHCLYPLSTAVSTWGKYIRTKIAIYNLQDILNLPKEKEIATLSLDIKGEIIFDNVSFYYQSNTVPILNQISLNIKEHEVIGIVGTSGSGKSTLARMISALYIPQQGHVYIDGTPVSQFNPMVLRQQIGFVLQESFLFHLTVFDNIRLSVPDASLDEVIVAAKLAGAHEFILKLSLGYDTLIVEGGSSLSGGQRQRIAIARALLAKPKILIFDEATSALDDESQSIIQKNMPLIAKDKTVIIIAHRLSSVRECQRIIVLENGEIIEQGNHHQLINKESHYKKLWDIQQGC